MRTIVVPPEIIAQYQALDQGASMKVQLEGGPIRFWAVVAVPILKESTPDSVGTSPAIRLSGGVYVITKQLCTHRGGFDNFRKCHNCGKPWTPSA